MIRRRIKRLPVVRGETVVGVVARSDLLKGLLAATSASKGPHSDAEIKAAIQAELDKLDWAPRASVRVEVKSGVVTFHRRVTDERLRVGLKVIAENTPVAPPSTITWPGSSRTRDISCSRRKTGETRPDGRPPRSSQAIDRRPLPRPQVRERQ